MISTHEPSNLSSRGVRLAPLSPADGKTGEAARVASPTFPEAAAGEAGAIELIDPGELSVHPLLAHVPERSEHDPVYVALLESVAEQGFLTPALIDAQGRILCGRHWRRVAAQLGCKLPCRRIEGVGAAEVILAELVVARHLPKGTLAFIAVPLLAPALQEARERRLACLRQGTEIPERYKIAHGGETGLTKPAIAARLGFSRQLLDQAEKLRELLEKIRQRHGAEPAEAIERQVLAGELNLGYALTAAQNVIRNKEAPARLDRRREHDRFFGEYGKKLGLHWEQADAAQREAALQRLEAEARQWSAAQVQAFSKLFNRLARACQGGPAA
ncbi:MAG: hypothetical protein D6781_10610 [Verrucomicrobia bacterium]|nr:MAG: hypothetical protein D6781_10610 [Verrucomicrobiota bacterium]